MFLCSVKLGCCLIGNVLHILFYFCFFVSLDHWCAAFCSDPACGVSPAEKLSPEHLQLLRNAFTCSKAGLETQEHKLKGSNRGTSEEHGLTFEEFWDVLKSVIGPNIEDTWCKRFFDEVKSNKVFFISLDKTGCGLYCNPRFKKKFIKQHPVSLLLVWSDCPIKRQQWLIADLTLTFFMSR